MWEYIQRGFRSPFDKKTAERLNEFGREGWECYAVLWNEGESRREFYFKRLISQDPVVEKMRSGDTPA